MSEVIEWIGVDWGTSNLRAFAIDANGAVVETRSSERGMGSLKPHEFEPALLEVIEVWLTSGKEMPIYACGMVGARQGWLEAEYRAVPCLPVSDEGLTLVQTADPRIHVRILPGLSQAQPADVMRGEETQIAGLLAIQPDFDGTICLPGTHSKWVEIVDGKVVGFQTFMTGELFSIISKYSVLKHSLSDIGLDRDAFIAAASSAVANPLALPTKMFSLRAGSLLAEQSPQTTSARLSGMLIGQELAIAKRYWESSRIVIIGADEISELYSETLKLLGARVTSLSAGDATLSGLRIAAKVKVAA